jgi:mercuric ion transport protein
MRVVWRWWSAPNRGDSAEHGSARYTTIKEKIENGRIESFAAALCCLGAPAVVSIVASIGLGFLIKDAILLPLMVLFLLVTVIGLYLGYRAHRRVWPLILGIVSSLVALFFLFVHTVTVMAYLAMASLVLASILNVIARQKPVGKDWLLR